MYMEYQIKATVGAAQRLHVESRSSKIEKATIAQEIVDQNSATITEYVEYVTYTITSPLNVWFILSSHNSSDIQLNVEDKCFVIQTRLGIIRLYPE